MLYSCCALLSSCGLPIQAKSSYFTTSKVWQYQVKAKSLLLPFLVNRATLASVSLAFGPHSYSSTVSARVWGWPSGSVACFTPMPFPEVLNAEQGNSMYHFSIRWFASTGYRTPIYRVHSEHSTYHWAMDAVCGSIPSLILSCDVAHCFNVSRNATPKPFG